MGTQTFHYRYFVANVIPSHLPGLIEAVGLIPDYSLGGLELKECWMILTDDPLDLSNEPSRTLCFKAIFVRDISTAVVFGA